LLDGIRISFEIPETWTIASERLNLLTWSLPIRYFPCLIDKSKVLESIWGGNSSLDGQRSEMNEEDMSCFAKSLNSIS